MTKREQVDNIISKLEFGNDDSKKYKFKAIYDSPVFARESRNYSPGFYYLDYLKKKKLRTSNSSLTTLEITEDLPKKHPKKPIVILKQINTAQQMGKSFRLLVTAPDSFIIKNKVSL